MGSREGEGPGHAPHGSRPHFPSCSQAHSASWARFHGTTQQLCEDDLTTQFYRAGNSRGFPQREGAEWGLSPQNHKETVGCPGRVVSLTPIGKGTDGVLFQVTVITGASQDVIPQLKKKYDVDTLDMVFLDHWKDRYLPDTLLLEVS